MKMFSVPPVQSFGAPNSLPPAMAAPSEARLILTPAADVEIGGNVTIFGTNDVGETVSILEGDILLDGSFAQGGDRIVLPGAASDFAVYLEGNLVILFDDRLSVSIPAGLVGATIEFDDGSLILLYDPEGQEFRMGGQVITSAPAMLTAPPEAGNAPVWALRDEAPDDPLTPDGILILAPGADVSIGGHLTVFGTQEGSETVGILSGPIALSGSFVAGGDRIEVNGSVTDFTAELVGSQILLKNGTTEILIPVGLLGVPVVFTDVTLTAIYDAASLSFRLGEYVIGEDPQPIPVPPDTVLAGSNGFAMLDDEAFFGGVPGGRNDDPGGLVATGNLVGTGGAAPLVYSFIPPEFHIPVGLSYDVTAAQVIISQNGTPILTVTLDQATGAYEVVLTAPAAQDRPDEYLFGFEENLVLAVAYSVTDGIGTATGFLPILVDDDNPQRTSESATLPAGLESVSSVIDPVFGGDGPGPDGGIGHVIGGRTTAYDPDEEGNFFVEGYFGTLVFNVDGSFTYTRTAAPESDVVDRFIIDIVDADGDESFVGLEITLEGDSNLDDFADTVGDPANPYGVVPEESLWEEVDVDTYFRIDGEIETAGDRDLFEIDLKAGETYEMFAWGAGWGQGYSIADVTVRLLDANGNVVATLDFVGQSHRGFHVVAPADGTYYVEVGAPGELTGTYFVDFTHRLGAVDGNHLERSVDVKEDGPSPAFPGVFPLLPPEWLDLSGRVDGFEAGNTAG